MKKWVLILALASLTINCSNDDENNIKEQLIGKWIWVESSGGIQGETLNPQTTGENRHIEITFDEIKYFTNGILTSEFDYYLQKGESIMTNEKIDLMIYENDRKQSIVLNENKLILYDECFDCYQNEYLKD
ncbi:MAG: hypothetical protein APF83_06960 [Lutibacter sp. BRH_c52]|nr:MAG: hypothetical protein APF83_06960 [Lutibacter sp. BRH_c52]